MVSNVYVCFVSSSSSSPFFPLASLFPPCFQGDELECIQPGLYRNVARQLNISVAMESMVSDAFLGVATEIFSAGTGLMMMMMKNKASCWAELALSEE